MISVLNIDFTFKLKVEYVLFGISKSAKLESIRVCQSKATLLCLYYFKVLYKYSKTSYSLILEPKKMLCAMKTVYLH